MIQNLARCARLPEGVADAFAAALLVVLLALVFFTFQDYGVAFDEGVQDQYGRYVLDWYLTFGQSKDALNYLDLYYYGGLFDLIAAISQHISPFQHFETRHLLNALVGVLGVVGCWRLARRLAGPEIALAAAVLLVLMPSWYGMMYINPKDIPFAAGMTWSLYYMVLAVESLPTVRWQLVAKLGLVIGLTLGVRIGGVLLFGYLGLILLLFALRSPGVDFKARLMLMSSLGCRVLLPTVVIAWIVMLAFWPYAQVAPFTNPLASIQHFGAYSPGIDTLFFGKVADEVNRPLFYLPVYLLIKMPEIDVALIALAIAAAVATCWRQRHRLREMSLPLVLLGIAIAVPLGYVLVTRPELYDAERHFLFLLPPLAIVCALAGRMLLRQVSALRVVRAAMVGVGVVCLLASTLAMGRLHPYEYAYYNELVGGIAGARGLFETEYWGSSLTEAAKVLGDHLKREGDIGTARVAVCGSDNSVAEPLSGIATVTDDDDAADYSIATTRNGCDAQIKGETIAKIERDGVDFAVIKDLRKLTARNTDKPRS